MQWQETIENGYRTLTSGRYRIEEREYLREVGTHIRRATGKTASGHVIYVMTEPGLNTAERQSVSIETLKLFAEEEPAPVVPPVKLFNHSTRGYLYEVELVPPPQYGNAIPASGCDILIRDKTGFVSSAKSENYHATPELALAAFVKRQSEYIAQTRERLSRELDALATATREPIASE